MLITAYSYALRCPFPQILKVNVEQWLLLSGGFRNIKAEWARRKGEGQLKCWVECQESWQGKAARKLWPIFQSKHESLNRDALETNSFPVHLSLQAEIAPCSGLGVTALLAVALSSQWGKEDKNGQWGRLASLEVVFTSWSAINCKQLEVVLPPLPAPPLQTTNLFLLLASSDQPPMENLRLDGGDCLENRDT